MSESYWWCRTCRTIAPPADVSRQEKHKRCGSVVEHITMIDKRIAELEAEVARLRDDLSFDYENARLREQLSASRDEVAQLREKLTAAHHNQVRVSWDAKQQLIEARAALQTIDDGPCWCSCKDHAHKALDKLK